MLKTVLLFSAASLAATTLLPTLRAQDFFNGGITARTAASAGIYVPAIASALDSLSLNPAGLANVTGPVMDLSAEGLLARGSFSNSVNVNSPMRFNAGAIPYGAFGIPLARSRWTVAAGFLPDLLSSSKWQFQDAPGIAGASYGRQNEKSAIVAFRIPVGVAYRINSRLAAGMTVSAVYNSNTLVMPYVFQSQPVVKGLKTLLDLHTNGFGVNTSFGIIVKPAKRVELAAAYRTASTITSSGNASGSLSAQFAALGIAASPTFDYKAQVKVQLPQAALLSGTWQARPALRLSLQSTWTGWNQSFRTLPVALSGGTNMLVNSLVSSSSLKDTVPLSWKDQFSFRAAAERSFAEHLTLSGGFVHATDPVPSSTLSPLTAAIMSNGLAAGFGYGLGRSRFDVAYQYNLTNRESVASSALLAGEFNNSTVKVGTQALIISTSYHF